MAKIRKHSWSGRNLTNPVPGAKGDTVFLEGLGLSLGGEEKKSYASI